RDQDPVVPRRARHRRFTRDDCARRSAIHGAARRRRRAHLARRPSRQRPGPLPRDRGQRLRVPETLRAHRRRALARPSSRVRDARGGQGRADGQPSRPRPLHAVDRGSWNRALPPELHRGGRRHADARQVLTPTFDFSGTAGTDSLSLPPRGEEDCGEETSAHGVALRDAQLRHARDSACGPGRAQSPAANDPPSDNGMRVTVNPGPLTNRGRVAWDVNGTGVFVTAYLAFTNGTETDVLFDSKPGLKNLTPCRGDAGGGFTVIATGFLTPR